MTKTSCKISIKTNIYSLLSNVDSDLNENSGGSVCEFGLGIAAYPYSPLIIMYTPVEYQVKVIMKKTRYLHTRR